MALIEEILDSASVSQLFARLADGSYRWLTADLRLLASGPKASWVEARRKARSAWFDGPNVQRPIGHDVLLATARAANRPRTTEAAP